MVMFEETDGTARNLAASQKISSPWQVHSAGTSPATAREKELGAKGGMGGVMGRGEKKYGTKEQRAQRQI